MSWQRVDLATIGDRPQSRPDICGLAYRGGIRHYYSGPHESAKTMVAYLLAIEEIRAGGTVLILDFEMGKWEARSRLRDLGATDNELARIHYFEPEEAANEETIACLLALNPTLVIIDAAAGAYSLHGLDDNKRADAEIFARLLVRPFWQRDISTIVLDHVVKNTEARGKYAIGSERKVGGADVHLGFESVQEINRGGRGLYKIVTHKDRPGYLPRPKAAELELVSDPETHAITWTLSEPREHDHDAGGAFRPTVLMERVSRYLEPQPEPVSRTVVENSVSGRATWVRTALDILLTEGFACETEGPRKARLVASAKPYRAADDTTPSDPVPPRPGTDSSDPVRRPPSIGTDGDTVTLAAINGPYPVPTLQLVAVDDDLPV
jgi:hypothetical protein